MGGALSARTACFEPSCGFRSPERAAETDDNPCDPHQNADRRGLRRVGLPGRSSNTSPALKTLIRRILRGSEGRHPRTRGSERHDIRGPVAENRAQSQTRLRTIRRAELIADYEAGIPVKAISAKYGIHRGTIPALVRRAGAEVRVAGFDAEERARAILNEKSGPRPAPALVEWLMGLPNERSYT